MQGFADALLLHPWLAGPAQTPVVKGQHHIADQVLASDCTMAYLITT